MEGFLIGVIVGLIVGQFLPPDIVNHYANKLKIKRSTVSETKIQQGQLFPNEVPTKKPGVFKRWKLKREAKKAARK